MSSRTDHAFSALQPGKVIVAGDWHGNARWAHHVADEARVLLADEEHKIILHAGDFGIWPGLSGKAYVHGLQLKCAAAGVHVFFIDGNHEDFTQVPEYDIDPADPEKAWIAHLPRGFRWKWHDYEWLALGGAVSPDRVQRSAKYWWPEEELTPEDYRNAITGGPCDVLLSHDVGSRIPLALGEWPRGWAEADRVRSLHHQQLMQDIADKVTPGLWFHGHYHLYNDQMIDGVTQDHPVMRVISLDMDGELGNYGVLNASTWRWDGPRG